MEFTFGNKSEKKLAPVTTISGAVLVVIALGLFAVETLFLRGESIFRDNHVIENPAVIAFEVSHPGKRYAIQINPDKATRCQTRVIAPNGQEILNHKDALSSDRIRKLHFVPSQAGRHQLIAEFHNMGFHPNPSIEIFANDKRLSDRLRLMPLINKFFNSSERESS